MTTFNSFMRSTNAAINRMERAHNRRVRREAQIEKARQKEEALANAALVVQQYNQLIELLTSVHKEEVEAMDWQSLYEAEAPSAPMPSHVLEEKAVLARRSYEPSFFDKLFKIVEKRKRKLDERVAKARETDAAALVQVEGIYRKNLSEWQQVHDLAKGVLEKDVAAYRDAISHFNPFSDVAALGSSISFVIQADHINADLKIQPDDVLPRKIYQLTSTGKLSMKEMPISKFNELYQDHICSCALRIGAELLALLPVDFVIVNAVGDLLNSVTGRLELRPVLSVAIFPDTLAGLQFQTLDPSDCMRNFVHRMQFSKTGGFRPIDALTRDCIFK